MPNPYTKLKRKKRRTKAEIQKAKEYVARQELNEAVIDVSMALESFAKAFDKIRKGVQRGYYFEADSLDRSKRK
jgi:hypothetical protein